MARGITLRRLTLGVLACVASAAVAPLPSSAQTAVTLVWAKNDGTSVVDNAKGVGLDAFGNVNVAGWTNGAFSGFTNAGPPDVYVAQYGPNGTRKWIRQFGSSALDMPSAIATDAAGNSFVVGHTDGNLDGSSPQSAGDIFLVKLSSTGAEVWRRQFGTTEEDQAGGIALDRAGNIFVVGSTMGSVTGGANAGDTDVVVAKFSPAGQQVWTKQFGSTNFDYGFGIAVDVWGTIAVVGETQGQFPGMRETGITDAFVASLRSDGTIRWLRQEDSGPDFAYNNFTSVVMDDYENIIVGGSTGGSYTEDTVVSGPLDAVVVAYNKFSARMWVRQFGTTSRDEVLSLSRAPSGDIFAVGNTRGRVFGYLGPVGATDAFIVKLSKSGVLTWLKQYGTTQVDQLLSVDSDASGKVVAAGYTKGALTPGMTPRDEDAVMMKWSAFDPVPRPSSTWATGKNVRQSVLLQLGNLTSPYGSTVKLAISGASRRNCSVVGSSIRTMRRGTCRLTISVTNISGVIRRTTVALTIV